VEDEEDEEQEPLKNEHPDGEEAVSGQADLQTRAANGVEKPLSPARVEEDQPQNTMQVNDSNDGPVATRVTCTAPRESALEAAAGTSISKDHGTGPEPTVTKSTVLSQPDPPLPMVQQVAEEPAPHMTTPIEKSTLEQPISVAQQPVPTGNSTTNSALDTQAEGRHRDEERSSKQARRGADVAATAPRTSSTDKQLATLKERYTQLKGSTPRGPYSNNPDWLRTKIAEMASSAPAQTTAAAPAGTAATTAGTAAAQTEKSARVTHKAPQPVAPAAVASAGKKREAKAAPKDVVQRQSRPQPQTQPAWQRPKRQRPESCVITVPGSIRCISLLATVRL
jgi:hypothetical protein